MHIKLKLIKIRRNGPLRLCFRSLSRGDSSICKSAVIVLAWFWERQNRGMSGWKIVLRQFPSREKRCRHPAIEDFTHFNTVLKKERKTKRMNQCT